jgi:uncharacterized protein (DUF58 family)
VQATKPDYVLEPREFRMLEGLRLNPRRTFSGRIRGERLTRRKGLSIEFADYRDYSEGDDLRHIDWNVLARLESAVIKTYQDEEDLAVYLLLDCSTSMEFGEPTKLQYAIRAACAFGYVGLASQDAVYPRVLGMRQRPLPALRGRSSFPRLANWATQLQPEGKRGLAAAVREFAAAGDRAGLVVLLSDGLDEGMSSAVRILAGRGHEVNFIQVLSPEEIDPDLEGDLRLLDAESGTPVEITANSQALKEYKRRLEEHCSGLQAETLRVGGRYTRTTTTQSLEALVKNTLKREGWLTG